MSEPVTAAELAEALRKLTYAWLDSGSFSELSWLSSLLGASERILAIYDAQQAEPSKPERDESRDIAIWRGLNIGDGRKLNGGPLTVWNQVSVDHYDCCDEIVCPYCGKSPNYSEECDGGEEGTFECECGHCEKTFRYSRNVSISYSSWR